MNEQEENIISQSKSDLMVSLRKVTQIEKQLKKGQQVSKDLVSELGDSLEKISDNMRRLSTYDFNPKSCLFLVNMNIRQEENKLKDLQRIHETNEDYLNLIESLSIRVKDSNGKDMIITRDNIEGFEITQIMIKSSINHIKSALNDLYSRKRELNNQINQN